VVPPTRVPGGRAWQANRSVGVSEQCEAYGELLQQQVPATVLNCPCRKSCPHTTVKTSQSCPFGRAVLPARRGQDLTVASRCRPSSGRAMHDGAFTALAPVVGHRHGIPTSTGRRLSLRVTVQDRTGFARRLTGKTLDTSTGGADGHPLWSLASRGASRAPAATGSGIMGWPVTDPPAIAPSIGMELLRTRPKPPTRPGRSTDGDHADEESAGAAAPHGHAPHLIVRRARDDSQESRTHRLLSDAEAPVGRCR